jgi:hypothetical protein
MSDIQSQNQKHFLNSPRNQKNLFHRRIKIGFSPEKFLRETESLKNRAIYLHFESKDLDENVG